jgi:hypothetical protein
MFNELVVEVLVVAVLCGRPESVDTVVEGMAFADFEGVEEEGSCCCCWFFYTR